MIEYIDASLKEAELALTNLLKDRDVIKQISMAGEYLTQCFRDNGHVFSCGNGGSMCDAMHFAEELSGRYRNNRRALGAVAMSDAAHMSCTANDFGFEYVFSRYLEGNARKGDMLLGISTSGTSPNIINAVKKASEIGMRTIALTGKPGSELGKMVDIDICTPGARYSDRVQELHIKVIHILIELVERKLFAESYG